MKTKSLLTVLSLLLASVFTMLVCEISAQINPRADWNLQNSGTTINLNAVDFISPLQGVVVGDAGKILKTTDGGQSWISVPSGTTYNLYDVDFIDETQIIAAGSQGVILYSQNGGNSWLIIQAGTQDYTIYGIRVDAASGKGIAGASGNTLLWSNDHGLNWSFVWGGFMNNYYCACMAGGNVGVVIGTNAIFQPLAGYTLDVGQSFHHRNYSPFINNVYYEGAVFDCYFFSATQGYTVGALWDGQGFMTTEVNWNSGAWNAITFPVALSGIHFSGSTGAVVGASGYIAETEDGGLTWQNASVAGNGNFLNDVVLVGNSSFAVGDNGEILKRTFQPVLPGDANCDGAVNVLDVVSLVACILGSNPQPFCPENADVNGDGLLNVLDAIGTVNIILGRQD